MFDTVVYKCQIPLRDPSGAKRFCPPGWKRSDYSRGNGSHPSFFDTILENELLGIRLFLRGNMIIKVEVDLPKLLFGHNGRLLATQSQIDSALLRLKTVLLAFCKPGQCFFPGDTPYDPMTRYTRVDLVWQFDVNPAVMLLALRNAKHPEINKQTGHYANQTVHLPGAKLDICAYDKKTKMRSSQVGNVMRVEVRYHHEKIAEHFGLSDQWLTSLDLDAAYSAYRSTLLQFQFTTVPCPSGKGSIADFLAWFCKVAPDLDAVAVYILMKGLCPRKSRELRKEVGKRVPNLVGFSWANLLPVGQLPRLVEVANPKREEEVALFFDQLSGPNGDNDATAACGASMMVPFHQQDAEKPGAPASAGKTQARVAIGRPDTLCSGGGAGLGRGEAKPKTRPNPQQMGVSAMPPRRQASSTKPLTPTFRRGPRDA